jgi:U6 snRNA-associated Sm-like protein LSm4
MLIISLIGETFNGLLVNCDSWMNINLKEVICTAPDGAKFWKIPEIHIRGNTIKYLRIPDAIIDKVKEEQARQKENYKKESGGSHRRDHRDGGGRRGGRGGRGGKR